MAYHNILSSHYNIALHRYRLNVYPGGLLLFIHFAKTVYNILKFNINLETVLGLKGVDKNHLKRLNR